MATLVLHERIHFEEDNASDCDWRKSNCPGKSKGKVSVTISNASLQWLPNQLFSVYDQMVEVEYVVGGVPECGDIMALVKSQRKTLEKEVEKFCSERSV